MNSSNSVTQAVILCGGKGERLGSVTAGIPKPLLPLKGRPVLDYIVDNLENAGIRRIVLAAGHIGEQIRDWSSTNGRRPGISMETVIEDRPLGTAGAVRALAGELEENFVLAYGDVFLDFDVAGLIADHEEHRPLATLLVRASDHPWDSHLVDADEDGHVVEFVTHRDPQRLYRHVANAAVFVLSRRILDFVPADRSSDFGADVFPSVVAAGQTLRTHALEPEGFVKDMGTPRRLAEVEEYIAERDSAARARGQHRPIDTVFLDRDGVLNEPVDLLSDPEALRLLPGVAEAVSILTRAGIRCVVLTNQPVLARGLCDEKTLDAIHRRLEELVAAGGGRIDAVHYCPHHPETHHGEGVPELRRACRCRKPAPGLIFRACREHALDLAACVMVGDRASDIRAARAAGIRAVLVGASDDRTRESELARPDAQFDSLLGFAQAIAGTRDLPPMELPSGELAR